MSFTHLFAVFTAFFVGLLHPTPHTSLLISPTPQVLGTNIHIPIPSISETVSPTPVGIHKNQMVNKQPLIDCIGPDGKHLQVTQQACDDFNNAWGTNSQKTNTPFGEPTKIADHTYELQLPPDSRMATPEEILAALNDYRQKHGIGTLTDNAKLSAYAQSRADFYNQQKKLDAHAGFTDYINNQDGFNTLGFNHLGENAAYAGPLNATHLIEWVFASDTEHNNNQLNGAWQYVGIGVNGIATDIVFGAQPR